MGDRDDVKEAVGVGTTDNGPAGAAPVDHLVNRVGGAESDDGAGSAGGTDSADAAEERDASGVVVPGPRTSPEDDAAGTPPRRRRWLRRRTVATAVLALAVLLAGALLYAAQQLKDPGASGNRALTDTAATDQVSGDVSNALSRIFAYTPQDTQSTAQAARDLLAGSAATQYQQLFSRIRQQVADQKLTLTTRVVRAGVVSLTSDRARLLVFLDQTAQRAGATATSAAAQLSVTAEYSGGRWRITDLKAR